MIQAGLCPRMSACVPRAAASRPAPRQHDDNASSGQQSGVRDEAIPFGHDRVGEQVFDSARLGREGKDDADVAVHAGRVGRVRSRRASGEFFLHGLPNLVAHAGVRLLGQPASQ